MTQEIQTPVRAEEISPEASLRLLVEMVEHACHNVIHGVSELEITEEVAKSWIKLCYSGKEALPAIPEVVAAGDGDVKVYESDCEGRLLVGMKFVDHADFMRERESAQVETMRTVRAERERDEARDMLTKIKRLTAGCVTKQSALQAINHVDQYNGEGRKAEAISMLASVSAD